MKSKIIIVCILLLIFVFPTANALTVSFVTTYNGPRVILVITVSGNITNYKWNLTENDGLYNGTTGWVNSTTIDNYIYTFTDTGSITVTLYAKNTTTGTNDSYSGIVESVYEPPIVYERYDASKALPFQGTRDPITGPTNPWFPWATAGDISVSGVANIVLFGSIFMVIMFFFLRSRKRGERRIKIGDYIIDFLEDE